MFIRYHTGDIAGSHWNNISFLHTPEADNVWKETINVVRNSSGRAV